MPNIGSKKSRLYIDFNYRGERFKVYLQMEDSPKNRKLAEIKLLELEKELNMEKLGLKQANLQQIFPNYKKFQNLSGENTEAEKNNATAEMIFKDYFYKWLNNRIHLSKHTKKTWDSFYRTYVDNIIGIKKIKEINEYDIIHLIESMKQRLKNSVINKKITCIRMVFKELYNDDVIDKNLFRNIKPLKSEHVDVNPFTKEELKKLLEGFKKYYPHYYNFVAFLAFTGSRPNEAVALRWSNVDWENKKILIREGYVLGEFTTLKTGSSRRDIDITPVIENLLLEQKKISYDKSDFVFVNHDYNIICWNNFRQKYYKLIKIINIKHRPIYQLRHTFASLAIRNGEDINWVSRTLGHANIKTTLTVYNRFMPNKDKDGKQINSFFQKIVED